MTRKDKNWEPEEADLDKIAESFESEERRCVYQYLRLIYPKWAKAAEICDRVESDYGNVMGALKGDGKRYSKKLALIAVGLVESKKKTMAGYKIYLYRARKKGSDALVL